MLNSRISRARIASPWVWGGAFFIIGAWLRLHPFRGIRHDGILYLGQTLAHRRPDLYASDIFFAYGSQDQFSIFSTLYSALIDLLGLPIATPLLILVGQGGFLGIAALLLRRLATPWAFWLGLAAIVVFPSDYGDGKVAYAESFLTARVLAEPLSLLMLLLAWRGRYVEAGLAGLAAVAMHPLIALPAVAAAWILLSLRQPRFWLLALGILLAPALGLLGVAPFPHLFTRIDPQWLENLGPDSMIFLSYLGWLDWAGLVFDFTVLAWAAGCCEGEARRFLLAVFAAALGGVLLTLAGADGAKNLLIAELQLWRGQWLAHLFALGLAPMLILRLHNDPNPYRKLAAWLLGAAVIAIGYRGGVFALLAALLLAGPLGKSQAPLTPWVVALVKGVCLLLVPVVAVKGQSGYQYSDMAGILSDSPWAPLYRVPASAVFWMGLGLLLAGLARRFSAQKTVLLLGASVLAYGVSAWDQRTGWARFLEQGLGYEHPFKTHIQPGQQVYWHGDTTSALAVWLLLERPNYYSYVQGAGLIFNRDKTLEYQKKSQPFKMMFFQEGVCAAMNTLNQSHEECAPSLETLKEVCADSPQLDFIILGAAVENYAEAKWNFQDSSSGAAGNHYLYRCARLKAPA
jgi:hypothetical protein